MYVLCLLELLAQGYSENSKCHIYISTTLLHSEFNTINNSFVASGALPKGLSNQP